MPHTLLTIDVWDTVLRRRCHPDEVKLFVARALWLRFGRWIRPEFDGPMALLHLRQAWEHRIGQSRVAAGSDDEYRIDDVLYHWAREAMVNVEPHFLEWVAAEMAGVEVGQEHRVTYADPWFGRLLAAMPRDRVVALSDFYLPGHRLAQLIEAKHPGLGLHDVMVSCDVSLNKRSGRLFELAQHRHGVEPAQHVHVGDNHAVDVRVPSALGVRAIHYHNQPQEEAREFHRERWARRRADVATLKPLLLRELRENVAIPGDLTRDQREIFVAGAKAAPAFIGLVLRAMEEAVRRGAERVHYFTREGAFFKQVHEAMASASPGDSLLGAALPGAVLLEVSRLATFAASVEAVTTREFMRLWNQYSTQSMGGLLASLNIPVFVAAPLLDAHALSPDEQVRYPWQDPRVIGLFEDRRFVRLVERHRDHRRDALRRYLRGHDFADDGRAKVIVDIGWRGTIQDNLARVLPATRLHGVYLGMQRPLNVQPPNVEKIAYVADIRRDHENHARLLQDVPPLEMLCNSRDGSVAGYEPDGACGGMRAVRMPDPEESAAFDRCSKFFQMGVLASVPHLTSWIRDYAMSADDLRPLALDAIKSLIADPPMPMATAFFALRHNETFGLGGFIEMRRKTPSRLAVWGKRNPDVRRRLDQKARESCWPCAFWRVHRLEAQRAAFAREVLGARPVIDIHATDPEQARAAVEHVESSRLWRMLCVFKRTWPMPAIARLRHGPSGDSPPPLADPVARLRWITASRTFRLIQRFKSIPLVAARARRTHGIGAIDLW